MLDGVRTPKAGICATNVPLTAQKVNMAIELRWYQFPASAELVDHDHAIYVRDLRAFRVLQFRTTLSGPEEPEWWSEWKDVPLVLSERTAQAVKDEP